MKTFFQKYKFVITLIVCVILFSLFNTCNNNKYQVLKGEYNILEEKYKAERLVIQIFEQNRKKEKDSLNAEIEKREIVNKQLISDNIKLEERIKAIRDRKINIPKDNSGLVNYFNERYNVLDNEVVDNKVGLTTTTAYNVSTDLEEGDKCSEIIPLKDEQIKNQDEQIANLEKDKSDIKIQLTTAEEENEKRKLLEASADKNINNLKSQVEVLNRKDTFNKILIPVSFLAGAWLGYELKN